MEKLLKKGLTKNFKLSKRIIYKKLIDSTFKNKDFRNKNDEIYFLAYLL